MGDDEVLEVEALQARFRARHRRADPGDEVAAAGRGWSPSDGPVVGPGSARPDVQWLWMVVQRLAMSQVGKLAGGIRWQICADDWEAIMQWCASRGQVQAVRRSVDGWWLLFDVPVVVVSPEPGRWPELVLVVDRRV